MESENLSSIIEKVKALLEEKKVEDIVWIDVREKCNITDFLLIGSCTSEPHLRAISKQVDNLLSDLKVYTFPTYYDAQSGWVIVDGIDFVIHLFTPTMREYYGLEQFWNDVPRL